MSYTDDKLLPQWQKRRLEILQLANWKCEDCQKSGVILEIHHTAYKTGARVWDYPNELLMALCRECHELRQNREDAIRIAVGKLTRFMTVEEVESEVWEMVEKMSVRQTARYAEAFNS